MVPWHCVYPCLWVLTFLLSVHTNRLSVISMLSHFFHETRALWAKTWRIFRIFNNKKLTVVIITNKQLLTFVAILLGIELVLHVLKKIYE
jgi:hypothetical protein